MALIVYPPPKAQLSTFIVTIFFKYALELSELKRLHEVLVTPSFAGACEKGGSRMAGDKDNGHVPGVIGPAYPPRCVHAAQAREAAVHQDQVRARALSRADSFLTIRRFDDPVTTNLQDRAKQQTRIFVVVRDEDERPRLGALRVRSIL
jgi:hypothetical protein